MNVPPGNPENWSAFDILAMWLALAFAALSGLAARIAYRLFDATQLPPEDQAQLIQWKRKRWWMAFSEFAALPAFATGWTAAAAYWHLPVPLVVLGSMGSGALGFGFLLHALQAIVQRRIDNA